MSVMDVRSVFKSTAPAWQGGAANPTPCATGDHYTSRPGNVSANGRKVAYSLSSGRDELCCVYNRDNGLTTVVSAGPDDQPVHGSSYGPALSPDGRYVVFDTDSAQLARSGRDVLIRDLQTGKTELVSTDRPGPDDLHYGAQVSRGGDVVCYTYEYADPDASKRKPEIFARDLRRGTLQRVDVNRRGEGGDGPSFSPQLSADGRFVAFSSTAANLVDGATNGTRDVFVHDLQTGATTRVSCASDGTQANGPSVQPGLSYDGRYVVFASRATNLSALDTGGRSAIYRHDCQTGETDLVSRDASGKPWAGNCVDPVISGDGHYVSYAVEDGPARRSLHVVDCRDGATLGVAPEDAGESRPAALSENGGYLLFSSTADALPKGSPQCYQGAAETYGADLVRTGTADPTVRIDAQSVVIGGVRIPRRA